MAVSSPLFQSRVSLFSRSDACKQFSRCLLSKGKSCRTLPTPRHRFQSIVVAADATSSSSSSSPSSPSHSTSSPSSPSSLVYPLLTSPETAHFVNLTNGLEAVPTLLSLGIRDFTLVRMPSTACEQRRFGDFLSAVDASLLAAAASGKVALVWDASSRDRGGVKGKSDVVDEEWEEALLDDDDGDGFPRCGGGLRCPRALYLGLELLRFACERAWRGNDEGKGKVRRAILGEAGHDVSADFEDALRGRGGGRRGGDDGDGKGGDGKGGVGVSEATRARIRYFRRFYRGGEGGAGDGGDGGGGELRIWGCYRPSRLDDGGGGSGSSREAQRALFELALSKESESSAAAAADDDVNLRRCAPSSSPPPPPPPSFSRDALARELASLGWGLFSGGEDRARRLRASRKRRNEREKK